jgi:hypothetical protein
MFAGGAENNDDPALPDFGNTEEG